MNVEDAPFRAIGDGVSRPLSQRYRDLSAAKADYPHITSLDDELDWAAIQGAMNQVSSEWTLGGKVKLAGNRRYVINRALRVPSRVTWQGDGTSTHLIYTGNGTAVEVDSGTGRVTNWDSAIKGLTLRAKGGARGIEVRDVSGIDVSDVAIFGQLTPGTPITGFSDACLYLGSSRPPEGATIVVRIRNSFFQSCRGDGLKAAEANAINQISIHQTRIQGNQGWGVNFQVQGRAIDIQGSDIEGNARGQVRLAGALGFHFAGNYLESQAPLIELPGEVETRGIVIQGNHIQGGGAKVTPTAIKLGGNRFPAEAVVIKGNWIRAVAHAFELTNAQGVDAGPNSIDNIPNPVAPAVGRQTKGVYGIPLPVQNITAPTSTILPWGGLTLLSNTSQKSITFAATPTIPDGLDHQEIRLLNTSDGAIVLQDQKKLKQSNLRLTAPQITIGPWQSVSLLYLGSERTWIQMSPGVGER